MKRFFQARMSNDEPSFIKHVVTRKRIDERRHTLFEFRRFTFELLQRFSQTVRDLHVSSVQLAHQLRIVISGNRECPARSGHAHHEFQNFGNLWTTIDQIADEDRFASFRMMNLVTGIDVITERCQQRMEFVVTSVYVADDVEWSMFVFAIVR